MYAKNNHAPRNVGLRRRNHASKEGTSRNRQPQGPQGVRSPGSFDALPPSWPCSFITDRERLWPWELFFDKVHGYFVRNRNTMEEQLLQLTNYVVHAEAAATRLTAMNMRNEKEASNVRA